MVITMNGGKLYNFGQDVIAKMRRQGRIEEENSLDESNGEDSQDGGGYMNQEDEVKEHQTHFNRQLFSTAEDEDKCHHISQGMFHSTCIQSAKVGDGDKKSSAPHVFSWGTNNDYGQMGLETDFKETTQEESREINKSMIKNKVNASFITKSGKTLAKTETLKFNRPKTMENIKDLVNDNHVKFTKAEEKKNAQEG